MKNCLGAISLAVLAMTVVCVQAAEPGKKQTIINPPPTAQAWADLAKLPDWSGVWNPKITDQDAQIKTNPPPWTPKAAAQIEHMFAEEKAGRPPPIFVECLPEAMPSWMLVTHNAMEFCSHPAVSRSWAIRRQPVAPHLYRRPPASRRSDPHVPRPSDRHWEGDTLVVDTVGIRPQTYVAVSEAAGVPNNGDLHIIERIHLASPDILHDDLEIIAPKVLTQPWKTTRIYFRQRARKFDIVEGVCLEGSFAEKTDKDGNAIYVPIPHQVGGNLYAPDAKR